jgi:hypothetical protein
MLPYFGKRVAHKRLGDVMRIAADWGISAAAWWWRECLFGTAHLVRLKLSHIFLLKFRTSVAAKLAEDAVRHCGHDEYAVSRTIPCK